MNRRRTLLRVGGALVVGAPGCLRMQADGGDSGSTPESDGAGGSTGFQDSLVARYRFEGDLADEDGRFDLDGRGVTYPDDAPDGRTGANWEGAYASTGFSPLEPDEPATFCFWFRDDGTRSTWDDDLLWKIESDGDDVGSFCSRSGEVFLFTSGGNTRGTSGTDLLDGRWHHAAFVLDPARRRMRLHVDGREEYDVHYEDRIEQAGETTLVVGNTSAEGYKQYDGDLDDLRIYGDALSASAIEAIADPS